MAFNEANFFSAVEQYIKQPSQNLEALLAAVKAIDARDSRQVAEVFDRRRLLVTHVLQNSRNGDLCRALLEKSKLCKAPLQKKIIRPRLTAHFGGDTQQTLLALLADLAIPDLSPPTDTAAITDEKNDSVKAPAPIVLTGNWETDKANFKAISSKFTKNEITKEEATEQVVKYYRLLMQKYYSNTLEGQEQHKLVAQELNQLRDEILDALKVEHKKNFELQKRFDDPLRPRVFLFDARYLDEKENQAKISRELSESKKIKLNVTFIAVNLEEKVSAEATDFLSAREIQCIKVKKGIFSRDHIPLEAIQQIIKPYPYLAYRWVAVLARGNADFDVGFEVGALTSSGTSHFLHIDDALGWIEFWRCAFTGETPKPKLHNKEPQPLKAPRDESHTLSFKSVLTFLGNHWRAIVATLFGIAIVVLAFTPAGPALAAALTLKAIFTPVFAWISDIGLWGIALGLGLAISGFVLGAPSWLLGETLMIVGGTITFAFVTLNGLIKMGWSELENFYEDAIGLAAFGWGCVRALAYVVGTGIHLVSYVVQAVFLFLAELGDDIFRKLGAPLMRLVYAPKSDVKILSAREMDQFNVENIFKMHASFLASLKIDYRCDLGCFPIEHAVQLRALTLVIDALIPETHPYDAASTSSAARMK